MNARRFGHRPVAVIDFGQDLALGTRQSGDGGADVSFVDAGVGSLPAGERKVVVQFGLWSGRAGPGERRQPGAGPP